MSHLLETPEAQAILRQKSLDDFIASTLFANAMMPETDPDKLTVMTIKATIYWLTARGATVPQVVMTELEEWN